MFKSSFALAARTAFGTLVALGTVALGGGVAAAETEEGWTQEEAVLAGECANDEDCGANANCNIPSGKGVSECRCNEGYIGGADGCIDADECQLGSDTCSADATCTNLVGGFVCSCNEGFEGDGETCVAQKDEEGCDAADAADATAKGKPSPTYARSPRTSLRRLHRPPVPTVVGEDEELGEDKAALEEAEEDEIEEAGALCSASPVGGADPSAIATIVAAAGVLVSRRRKS